MGANGASSDGMITDDEHAKNRKNLVNEDILSIVFTEEERKPAKWKLKVPVKPAIPSTNWKEMDRILDEQEEAEKIDDPDHTKTSASVTLLSDKDVAAFPTAHPGTDSVDTSLCKTCKKNIGKIFFSTHLKACQKAKADKAKERKKAKEEAARLQAQAEKDKVDTKEADSKDTGDDSIEKDETKKMAKKTAKGGTKPTKKKAKDDPEGGLEAAAAKNSKKRKATDDKEIKEKEPKKKKAKEKPAKAAPKPKGPVDVERQCGVALPQGGFCARSLTCKSHSMGAKRAVLGRSQPYDILLAAYQKKNQAKQQKAAINANNPAPEDLEANSLHVDSDEETEYVMQAVARSNPQPLVHHVPIQIRRKYQATRMFNLLGGALRPPNDPLPPMSAASAGPLSGFLSGHGFGNPMGSPTVPSPVSGPMGRPAFPASAHQPAARRLSVALVG